ncbi:MAG: hypothetical protein RMK18_07085 [Armatimonadota bacterium]|nr:hypothetical protein [Armatimonadota bacterium]MDW8025613.1 hypothetical protein [Armatimonadota bacterium]
MAFYYLAKNRDEKIQISEKFGGLSPCRNWHALKNDKIRGKNWRAKLLPKNLEQKFTVLGQGEII